MGGNPDKRVRAPVSPPDRVTLVVSPKGALIAAAVAVFALAGGIGIWLAVREPPRLAPAVAALPALPPSQPPLTPAVASAAPVPLVRVATETEILNNEASTLAIFRFASNPDVLVLDFPDLLQQAHMLNRVAALIEKGGLPRDHVLDETAMAAAVKASGGSEETFYYGHDYSAAALARFFMLADRDHIALTPEESTLRLLLDREGLLAPGSHGALISVPRIGSDPSLDLGARATILHHELSHGEYFSNPVYAAFARKFFHETITEQDRAVMTRFLVAQGYDSEQEDLMVNEDQAYLIHTPESGFFSAESMGVPASELARLRIAFVLGMPPGWLRDSTAVTAVSQPAALQASPAKARKH